MKKILVAALLSAVVATPAFAAPNGADAGAYGGFTVGQSKTDSPLGYVSTDDTDTGGSLFIGYQYTKNWSVEAFYANMGNQVVRNAAGTVTGTGDSDAYGLNVVGTAPLNESFSLYGKLGYARTQTDFASTPAGTIVGRDLSGITGGVGGLFNIDKKVGIRFGWDTYELSTAVAGAAEDKFRTDLWSVGVVFKF